MGKRRMRPQDQPIIGREVKPRSSQIGPFFSSRLPSPFSNALSSFPWQPLANPPTTTLLPVILLPRQAARVTSVKLKPGHITSLFKTPQQPVCPTFHHASSPRAALADLPRAAGCQQNVRALLHPILLPSRSLSPQSSLLPQEPCTLGPFCQSCSSLLRTADLLALSLSCTSSKSSFLAIRCKGGGKKKKRNPRPSLNSSLSICHPNPRLSREFHEVMKRGTRCCFFTITPVPRTMPRM